MKTTLNDHSPALVQAIRDAFHHSDPCHCKGPGKLSEDEVLAALVLRRHVKYADVTHEEMLPIAALFRGMPNEPSFDLNRDNGVSFLPQLESWTFTQLVSVHRVGPVTATKIEALMAQYGLALKDGDQRRYQHLLDEQADQPAADRRPIDAPPEELRKRAAKELFEIGQRLVQHGAALMKFGVRASMREKIGGYLKKATNAAMRFHGEAISVAELLQTIEQREATPHKTTKRGRRGAREIEQRGTVVTGAFPPEKAVAV